MKKADLLRQLNDQLQKGELKDPTVITKVELADERLVDIYLRKLEENRKKESDKSE